ncbi:MAG: hypothetical protein IJX46_09750 [Clostridia bacterium]|nr:hypothetical protein [Clostridia bacterium]
MKKSFYLLVALLIVALLMVGCGGDGSAEGDSTTKAPDSTTTTPGGDTTTIPGGDETTTPIDPDHTHTFENNWTTDENNHWHAASCEHKEQTSDLAPHADNDANGLCDTCEYRMTYKVTVTAPEGFTVEGTLTAKPGEDVTFTVTGSPAFALTANGAEQDGEPEEDGIEFVWSFTVSKISADTEVTVEATRVAYAEVILEDEEGEIGGVYATWKYYYGTLTLDLPSAGKYLVFSSDHEDINFGPNVEGGSFAKEYVFEVDKAGEYTVKSRIFPMSEDLINDEDPTVRYFYYVVKIEDTVELTETEGSYLFPSNTVVNVKFTLPTKGLYEFYTSVEYITIDDALKNSHYITATEDNQEITLQIKLLDITVGAFDFDWSIKPLEGIVVNLGDTAMTVDMNKYTAYSFTAPADSDYLFEFANENSNICTWEDTFMMPQGHSYMISLEANETFLFFVRTSASAETDLQDTLKVVNIGKEIFYDETLGGNAGYASTTGATNYFVNNSENGSFYEISVGNGVQISVDGGKTWATVQEVYVEANSQCAFLLKADKDGNVRVDYKAVSYELTFKPGENTVTLKPGKEYTVHLSGFGTSGAASICTYAITWTVDGVTVTDPEGQVYVSGTTANNYSVNGNGFTVVYNGTEPAEITFTAADMKEDDGSYIYAASSPANSGTLEYNPAAGTVLFKFSTYAFEYTFTVNNGVVTLSNANGPIDPNGPMAQYFGKLELGADGNPSLFYYNGNKYTLTLQSGGEDEEPEIETALNGKWNVLSGMFVLEFNNGALTIVDNNNGAYSGSYTYTGTLMGGITVLKADGSEANIIISLALDGVTPTFLCSGMPMAQNMTRVTEEEEDEELVEIGNGSVSGTITETYTWDDYIEISATVTGKYIFTVPAGLGAWDAVKYETEFSSMPYVDFNNDPNGGTFAVELTAGEIYKFHISAATKGSWTVTYVIMGVSDQPDDPDDPEIPEDIYLEEGENTITVSDTVNGTTTYLNVYENANYTFTANGASIAIYDTWGMPMVQGFGAVTVDLEAAYMGSYTVVIGAETAGDYVVNVSAERPVVLEDGENTVTVPAEGIDCVYTPYNNGKYTFTGTGLTVVVTDGEGNVVEPAGGEYTLESYLQYKITVTAETAGEYTLTVGAPVILDNYGSIDVKVDGSTVVFLFTYDRGYYTVKGEGLTFVITDADGNTVENGALLDGYTTYTVTVSAATAGDYSITVEFAAPAGSYDNPDKIESFPATLKPNLPSDWSAYYYEFTATETGHVTLTVNGTVIVTLAEVELSEGETTVTAPVVAGKTYIVYFYSETPATVEATLTFEAGALTEAEWGRILDSYNMLDNGITIEVSRDMLTNVYYVCYIEMDEEWNVICKAYYTYTVTDNNNGTLILNLTAMEHEEATGNAPVITAVKFEVGEDGWVVTVGGDEPELPNIDITGTYVATDSGGNTKNVVVDDTTVTISFIHHLTGDPMTNSYAYTFIDGVATIVDDEGNAMSGMGLTVTDGKLVGLTDNGTEYTVTEGDGDQEGE